LTHLYWDGVELGVLERQADEENGDAVHETHTRQALRPGRQEVLPTTTVRPHASAP
jgi:hypothetical protein